MRLDAAGKNAVRDGNTDAAANGRGRNVLHHGPLFVARDGVAASKHGKRGKRVKLRCRHAELLAIGLRKRTANADKALARVRKIAR